MSATALKGASITEYRATNGSTVKSTSSGSFDKTEVSSFSFSIKDNRGLAASKNISLNLIEYFKPTCKAEVALELDTDTTLRAAIKISGNFFNGSFGYKKNSLEILIKHSAANDWISLTKDLYFEPTTNGNTYSIDFGVSGLDYTKPFTYQCKVVDLLDSAISAEETLSYNPLFDWGAEDFNFNVPVKMNGNTVLRHTDANKVVVSAEGADIYLRPNGTNKDDGQLRLFTDGTATLNGSRILTVDTLYPVGAIYMSLNATNPSAYFGGTWEQIKDRFLLAAGANYEAGTEGGETEHTLTVDEMPSHNHDFVYNSSFTMGALSYPHLTGAYGAQGTAGALGIHVIRHAGGGAAHNNMPPYLTVYMWKRIA
jgi:hypothetical protein